MATPAPPLPHRPGAISLFFVVKAAVFAAGFWAWLLVLVVTGTEVGGLHILAATGTIITTLVSVLLGVRMALQRSAADRHAELKRLLVDISWNAFAAAGNAEPESNGNVVPFPSTAFDASLSGGTSGESNGDRRH
ncbi:hypothetical protein BDK92_4368 [Micromonospora pisi]|uniref:Uncharacterized protein n=1 Tax=Micromonospora pisi TaxID=589240 RepID=A0A495JNQ5_9ACTN|nr:hypothetical protein [Micromonospora pisi]RKR90004.1 hypothetical protein BDK92_4368 [Micromonospora pisi]